MKFFDKLSTYFKKGNNKVVPMTIDSFSNELTNSSDLEPQIVSEDVNSLNQTDQFVTYYLGIPGSVDIYANKSIELDKLDNPREIFPFKKMANTIMDSEKGLIPLDDYFNSERSAFNAIKIKYPNHAVTILKCVIPMDDLDMIETRRNGKKTYDTRPDLIRFVVSMKGLNTKNDTPENLKMKDIYIKIDSEDSIRFERTNMINDNSSTMIRPKR